MAWAEVDGDPFKKIDVPTPASPEAALPPSSALPQAIQARAPGIAPGIDETGWKEVTGNPFEEAAPQKGLAGVAGEALTSGIQEGLTTAKQGLTDPFSISGQEETPKNSPQLQKLLDTPLIDAWWKPDVLAAHMIHSTASASPTFALGAGGAALGAEFGPAGPLVGGAAGFGFGAALQAIRPAYERAISEGLGRDAAVKRAMTETGITGAFAALMGLAPGMSLFGTTAENALKRPLTEALTQVAAVQPGLAVGQQAAINLSEGKPLPTVKEAANTALEMLAPGAAMVGGHAAIGAVHNALTGAGKPTPPTINFEGKPYTPEEISGILPRPETPGGAGEPPAPSGGVRAEEPPVRPGGGPAAPEGPTPTEAEHIARINEAAARMLPHGVNEVNVFRNDAGDIVVPRTNQEAPYPAPKNLYSYGTEKGFGADLVGLGKAKAAETSGQHPEDIWNNFGWYHDPHDRVWVRHIDDSQAKVKPEAVAEWEKNAASPPQSGELFRGKLSDFVDHPELFKDTPAAGDVGFVVMKPDPTSSVGGWFSPNGREITVIAPNLNPASAIKTAVHEIDHFMQSEHGRTNGGSPERMHAMNWMALHDIKQQLRHIDQTGEGRGMVPWLLDQQAAIKETMGRIEPIEAGKGFSGTSFRAYRRIHGENMAEAASQANEAEKRRPGAGAEFPERHMETSPRETHPHNRPLKIVPDTGAPARKEAVHRAFEEVTAKTPFFRRDETSPLHLTIGRGDGTMRFPFEPEALTKEIATAGGHVVRQRIEESLHAAHETEVAHAAAAHDYERDAQTYRSKLIEADPEKERHTRQLWSEMRRVDDKLSDASKALTNLYQSNRDAGDHPDETYSALAWDVFMGKKTVRQAAPRQRTLQDLITKWVEAQRDVSDVWAKRRNDPLVDEGYIKALDGARSSERALADYRRDALNLEAAREVVSHAIKHGGDAVAFRASVGFEPVEGIPRSSTLINPQDRNKLIAALGKKVVARAKEFTGRKMTNPEAQRFIHEQVADPLIKHPTFEAKAVENAFPEEVADIRNLLEQEHYSSLRNMHRDYGVTDDTHGELSPAYGLSAQSEALPGRSDETSQGEPSPHGLVAPSGGAPARGRGVAGTETISLPGYSAVVTADKPLPGRTDRRTYRVYPDGLTFNRLKSPVKQHGEPLGYAIISRHPDGRWQVDDVDTLGAPKQRIAPKLYDAIEQHLGAKIEPSGYLTKAGFEKLWTHRDHEAVKWHTWSDYQGHYLSPLQVRNMLDLIERRLAEPGLDLKSDYARALPAERAELARLWDNLPREAQEAAKPEKMFSLPKEGKKGEVNDSGFVLALPHDEWGNPRFEERDRERALTRLDDIAKMGVRTAPWEDVVAARQDIAKIVDNLLYYNPKYDLSTIRERPNGDLYRYVSERDRPQGEAQPEHYRPSIYTDPRNTEDMRDIVNAAREAVTHLLDARRAGVHALLTHGTVTEPASAVRRRAGPGDIAETMPSGFYFAAARKLADIPDTTFRLGAQAVINALSQAGVKRTELNHLQLDKLAETGGPVTRQQFQHAIGERLFDFKRKLSRLNPERSSANYEMGGTRAFRGPRIPGRGTYFERLMSFPKKLAGGAPFAPGFFISPHWKTVHENAWASWRGSLREVPSWGNMVIGEEGQTDYMQGARGEGAKRPLMKSEDYLAFKAERKKYEKVFDSARDELLHPSREAGIPFQERETIIGAMQGRTKSGAPLPPDTWDIGMGELRARVDAIANPDTRAFCNKSLDKAQAIHDRNPAYFAPGAYARYMETETRFTPTTPIDESYVGTMVRDLLLHAAKEGADSVAISTSDSTRRIQANDSAGHFYDQQLMPTLQRELRRITNDGGLTLQKVNLPKGLGGPKKEKPYTVWAAKLTPETRVKILTEGQPLFSLVHGEKPAQQPRLAALHNLTEENLAFADKMGGGIAVPSIGVVKEGMGIGGFGDITLVGNRDIADPAKNPVFDADAYTARFPRPEYKKAKEKPTQKIINELRPFATKFKEPGDLEVVWDKMVNYPDPQAAISQMVRSEFGKAAFAKQVLGKDVAPVMRSALYPHDGGQFIDMPAFAKIAEEFKDRRVSWETGDATHVRLSKAMVKAIKEGVDAGREGKALRPALRKNLIKTWTEQLMGDDGLLPYNAQDWLTMRFRELGNTVVDSYASKERLDEEIKGHEEDYKKWVEDKILPPYGDPYLTLNRKKVPYTLDNIVSAMTSAEVKGKEQTLAFGAGQVRAAAATRFSDLEWMRKEAEKGIQNPAEVLAAREKVEAALESYRAAVLPYFKYTDTWSAMDGAMRALGKTITARYGRNAPNFRRELAKEDFVKVPEHVLAEGLAAAEMLLTAPVPYFEAKPQRVVSLGEFQGAVVPNTASPATIATLQKHGLTVRVYDRGNGVAGEQQAAAATLAQELAASHGTLFALKGFYSPAGRAIDAFPQPRATVAQWKALLTPGKIPGVTRDWGDFIGIDDVLAKLADDKGRVNKDELAAYIKTADVDLDLVTLRGPDATYTDETSADQESEAQKIIREMEESFRVDPAAPRWFGATIVHGVIADEPFIESLKDDNAYRALAKKHGLNDSSTTQEILEAGIKIEPVHSRAFEENDRVTPFILTIPGSDHVRAYWDDGYNLEHQAYGSRGEAILALKEFQAEQIEMLMRTEYSDASNEPGGSVTTQYHEYSVEGVKYIAELLVTAEHIKGLVETKHFEMNEILHRRLGEVELSDGTRALMDMEGQSDLHAKGEKEGYYTPASRAAEIAERDRLQAAQREVEKGPREKIALASDGYNHNSTTLYEMMEEKEPEEFSKMHNYVAGIIEMWRSGVERGETDIPVKPSVQDVLSRSLGRSFVELSQPHVVEAARSLAQRTIDAIPEKPAKLIIKFMKMSKEGRNELETVGDASPLIRPVGGGVPNIPYKNGLWLELGSKLALRFAIEHGYDAIVIPRARQIGDAVGASGIGSFEWRVIGNDLHVTPHDRGGAAFRDDVTNEKAVTILRGDPQGGFGAAIGWMAKKFSPEAAEQVRFDIAQGDKAAFQDNPVEPDHGHAAEGPLGMTREVGTGYAGKDLMPEGGAANLGMQLQYEEKMPAFYAKYTAKWGGKITDEPVGSMADTSTKGRLKAAISVAESKTGDTRERFQAALVSLREVLGKVESGIDEGAAYAQLSPDAKQVFNAMHGDMPVLKVLRITPEMRAAVTAGQPLYALKGFYSAGRKAVENFQANASVEQWRALLKPGKIPGVTANWVAMMDLDGWLDGWRPGQKVSRKDLLEYIDMGEQPVDEKWSGNLDPNERGGLTEPEAQNMARDNAENIADEQIQIDSVPEVHSLSNSGPMRLEFDAALRKMEISARDSLLTFMRDAALGPEHGSYWAGSTDDIMGSLFPEEGAATPSMEPEKAPLTALEARAQGVRSEVQAMRSSDDMTNVLDRFDAIAREFGQKPFSAQKAWGAQTEDHWGGPAIMVGAPDGAWAVVYGNDMRPDLFDSLADAEIDVERGVAAQARHYWNDRDRRNDIYEEELASVRNNYTLREDTHYEDYNIPGVEYVAEVQLTLPGFNWKNWKPPHFGEPNLVFMQLGEVKRESGNTALIPISIQADVHQQGREHGYATPSAIESWQRAMDDYGRDETIRREAMDKIDEVRGRARDTAYELSKIRQEMTPTLWKAVRAENSKELSIRDVDWYVNYEDAPEEARALMDKIDPEYGDKLASLRKENKRLRDRADELTRDLPEKPTYPGQRPDVPDAPFKGDAAPELAVRKLLQIAVEHGYSHIILPTAEQAAEAAGARKVTSLKWRRTEDGIEITPTQGDDYGGKENEPRLFKYGSGGDTASAYSQLGRRTTKDVANKIKSAIDAGEVDGEVKKLSIVNFGMQRQYEDAIPNYATKLVKKLGGVVSLEKIPDLFGDGKNVVIEIAPRMRDAIEGGQPLYNPGAAPAALPAFMQDAPRKQVVQGYWSPRQRTIGVALSHGDPMEIFYEEAAHGLGPKGLDLLSKTQLSVLRSTALKEGWIEKYIDPENIKKYRAAYGYTGDVDGMLLEEAIAHRYADYAVTRDAEGLPEASAAVFDRVREFFRRTRRALNDKGAFTVGDIFGSMYTGDVGKRGKPRPPVRFYDLLPAAAAGVSQLVAFDDLVPGQKPLVAFHDLIPAAAGALLSFDDLVPQRAASM